MEQSYFFAPDPIGALSDSKKGRTKCLPFLYSRLPWWGIHPLYGLVFFNYGLISPLPLLSPALTRKPMGMLGEATGSILRLPRLLGTPVRAGVARVSTRQLDTILNQVESATLKAKELVAGKSVAELTTSIEPTSWSVAQCLDHLAQTTNAFLPAISDAIARAPRLTTNRALRTGTLTRLFIRNLEPPYRLRFKVLAPLVPRQCDFNTAWDTFVESQVQLTKTIKSAAGLAVDQTKIESPVYARFSYNVYGALRMLAAHERRHIWQIEQILKVLGEVSLRSVS